MGIIIPALASVKPKAAAPAPPKAPVPDSERPLSPAAQNAVQSIVRFNAENDPKGIRTFASVAFYPQWTGLDPKDQQEIVDTLATRAKAYKTAHSSSGIGAMLGGIGGSLAAGALAPETFGASFAIPVIGAALGGAAGNSAQQVIQGGRFSPKTALKSGAEQGLFEVGGQGLQFGGKALLKKAMSGGAMTAADRAIAAISEKFGLGAGPPEIAGKFRTLVEGFGPLARTKGIQDAAAGAARDQMAAIGPRQLDTAATRDALRDAVTGAQHEFSARANSLWDTANELNGKVNVPLGKSMPTVESALQGKLFGPTAGMVKTPAMSKVQAIAGSFIDSIDRAAAQQAAPEANAVADEVARALTDPRVLGNNAQLAKFGPELEAAMRSGDMKKMQTAAKSLMDFANAPAPASTLIDPRTGKSIAVAADNGLAALRGDIGDFLAVLSKARRNPSIPFPVADQTLKDLAEFRPDPRDPDAAMQKLWASKLSNELFGDIDKATAGTKGNTAWKEARQFYHNASSFRDGLGKQILEGNLDDVGVTVASPTVTDEDVKSLFNGFDQLGHSGRAGKLAAQAAKDKVRVAMTQQLLGNPQGAELATRGYLSNGAEKAPVGWSMADLAKLPESVEKISPSKIDAIFGAHGPSREAFDNLVDIGKVVNRITPSKSAQILRWAHYPVMMGIGAALTAPFQTSSKGPSSFMTTYATGALGGFLIARTMASIVTSPTATRYMLKAVEDSVQSASARGPAQVILMRSAAANAARATAIGVQLMQRYQAGGQLHQFEQAYPGANPATPAQPILAAGGGQ